MLRSVSRTQREIEIITTLSISVHRPYICIPEIDVLTCSDLTTRSLYLMCSVVCKQLRKVNVVVATKTDLNLRWSFNWVQTLSILLYFSFKENDSKLTGWRLVSYPGSPLTVLFPERGTPGSHTGSRSGLWSSSQNRNLLWWDVPPAQFCITNKYISQLLS